MSSPSQSRPAGPILQLALPWLLTAALFGLFLVVASPRFETNDDIAMMRIASGQLTGKPSEYLVFTHFAIGKVLAWLYARNNSVNWYSTYLYAVHFFSMVLLGHVLLRRGMLRGGAALFLIVFLVFETRALLLLQFTTTAAAAGTSGLLALASASTECKSRLLAALGLGFVALASMIRIEVLYILFPLAACLALLQFWTMRSLRPLAWLAAAGIIAAGSQLSNEWYYRRNPEWAQFRQYNHARGRIHGLTRLVYSKKNTAPFQDIGWSGNDANAFYHWIFADDDVYSLQHLETLRSRLQDLRWTRASVRDMLHRLPSYVTWFFAPTLLLITLAWFQCSGYAKRDVLAVTLMLVLAAGIVAYASLQRELPDRVIGTLLLFLSAASAYAITHRSTLGAGEMGWFRRQIKFRVSLAVFANLPPANGETPVETGASASNRHTRRPPRKILLATRGGISLQRIGQIATSAALAVAVCGILLGHVMLNESNIACRQSYERLVESLKRDFLSAGQIPVFLDWNAAFPFEWAYCLSNYNSAASLNIVSLGWLTNSPQAAAALQARSIANPYQAICERPDVYTMSTFDSGPILTRFLFEHGGRSVTSEIMRHYSLGSDQDGIPRSVYVLRFRPSQTGSQPVAAPKWPPTP